MQFGNRNEFRAFSMDINAALVEVAKKYGVTIDTGNGRYNGDAMTLKLEITNKSATGETQDKYAVAFKQRAYIYGLAATDLGRSFVSRVSGKTFVIAGLNSRAKEYPIIAIGQNGKRYKFDIADVKAGLK